MNIKSCPVFVSSADSYADLWPIFFDLFKRYWPAYNGRIYLNTEQLEFTCPGLDIVCTKVGKLGSFGKVFRAGLEFVDAEDVMLIMIDYLFMGDIDAGQLEKYFDIFKRDNLDSFCLVRQDFREVRPSPNGDFNMVIPPSKDMFSYQTAFWKKSTLREMALPHENPWASEWFGTARANAMRINLACPKEAFGPIPYLLAGGLHKGKWLDEMVAFLNERNYKVDFSKRGYYKELPTTLKQRFTTKWMLIKSGLDGSYKDLLFRKPKI